MATFEKRAAPKRPANSRTLIVLLLLLVLLGGWLLPSIIGFFKDGKQTGNISGDSGLTKEEVFRKEGELVFRDVTTQALKAKIDIEIADNDGERMNGLMNRSVMSSDQGMVFIMESNVQQSFWMKNTILSLDIIYVGQDKKIVSIQANTIPFSEAPLPSTGPALYVVEVNAGFSKSYNLKTGDSIEFSRQ